MIGLTRAREDNRVVWLDWGTSLKGFKHIIDGHFDHFAKALGVYGEESIARFILRALSRYQTVRTYSGRFPGSIVYVYRFGRHYMHVVVVDDRCIITAYPVLRST
ncbi:MAG: hypothetical protein ACFFDB_20715 [Promethearchaeota archaeon]